MPPRSRLRALRRRPVTALARRSVATIGALLALSGCVTSRPAPQRTAHADAPLPATGILVEALIRTEDPEVRAQGCVFAFHHDDGGSRFEFRASAGRSLLAIDLPPGSYQLHGVRCGRVATFTPRLDAGFRPLRVPAGKVAYYGPLALELEPSRDELLIGPAKSFESVTALLRDLAPSEAARLVSAASGRAIPPAALLGSTRPSLEVRSAAPRALREGGHPDFTDCYVEEGWHPTVLGRLEVEVAYRNGGLRGLRILRNESTATPEFLACLENTARAFRTPTTAPLVIRYSLGNV